MKRHSLYIFLLVAAIALVITVELLTPKPIDWRTTYDRTDKIPFGSKILYELLPDIFPGQPINVHSTTLYENKDNLGPGNYLFIGDSFTPAEQDLAILLELVANGSQAFIAAGNLSNNLLDTLDIETDYDISLTDTVLTNLTNPRLKAKNPYIFTRINSLFSFQSADSAKVNFQSLGTISTGTPNFIRIRWGKGSFYLHAIPQVYTNYNMLARKNEEYISKTLSYLPVQPVYWQEYYKGNQHESQTPFRFIISTPPLRWAFYLSLLAVVIFVLFEAKRRQRIIPIVKPLANTTLEFTQTIGRLYFQHKDHKNIAEKQITYFLDHLRSQYYTSVQVFDEALYERLVQKTGQPKEDIVQLFKLITFIRSQSHISQTTLLELNQRIEKFEGKTNTLKAVASNSRTHIKELKPS
jgi:hypothetical protein